MNMYLLTMQDAARPIPQVVEIYADQRPSPEYLAEKVNAFITRFIRSDRVSCELAKQPAAERSIFYSRTGNPTDAIVEQDRVDYEIKEVSFFTLRDRNAVIERI